MNPRQFLTATLAALVCSSVASATVLTLSTNSSDGTSPSLLQATFNFTVAGNVLTLAVTNDTDNNAPGDEYNINMIYFNFGGSITAVTVTAPLITGWSQVGPVMVDGFGMFDVGMENGVGENDPDVITPGETVTFTFNLTGAGAKADFVNSVSTLNFFIAAKFVSGPSDDSAFGALIPLPMALPMGIAGLIGVAFMGRRTRAKQPRRAA